MNRFQTIYASKETGRWGIFDHQYDLGITGLIYVQDIASATWVFRHNLNQLPFLLEFFRFEDDGTRVDFKPADVQIDNNVITVTEETAITGTIVVIFAHPVEFAGPPTPTPTVTPTVTPSSVPLLVFASPAYVTNFNSAFSFLLSSDSVLTNQIFATTATVTNVVAYVAANANDYNCNPDINNCNIVEWVSSTNGSDLGICGIDYSNPWGSGPTRDSTNYPVNVGATIVNSPSAWSFDPTGNLLFVSSIPELNYDSFAGTINGVSGPWTIVVDIMTDLGPCTFICGNSFCF